MFVMLDFNLRAFYQKGINEKHIDVWKIRYKVHGTCLMFSIRASATDIQTL